MSQVTVSTHNFNKPAPRWFRRGKNALGYLIDGFITIWLLSGHSADSLVILISRIGYATLVRVIESLIANGEDYTPTSIAPNDAEQQHNKS